MTPNTTACGIYARISRDDDGTALGVTRQLDDCTLEAERRGWTVTRTFVDNDVSASRGTPRPQYVALLDAIRAGDLAAVIVWDIDRLTRTPAELETFIDLADRHGLALASIGGEIDLATPQGRLTARIKGSVARHEVEQASRRLKRKFQASAAAGAPHGVIPFGYRREKVTDEQGKPAGNRDVIVPEEAAALRELYRRIIAGESLRSAAKHLNDLGMPTRRGNKWQGNVVGNMLRKPRYVGMRTHQGEVVGPGNWEAIIDRDTFDRATAVLAAPGRIHSRGVAGKYLGSGLYRCGRCGAGMRPILNRERAGGYRKPAYGCPSCMRLTRKMEPVDEVVEAVIVARLEDPALLEYMAEDPSALTEAVAARDAILARMDGGADAFAAGTMTARQLARVNEQLSAQLEAAERQVRALQPVASLEDVAGPDAAKAWAHLSLERKREVLRTLATVTVLPAGTGMPFQPEQVRIEWNT